MKDKGKISVMVGSMGGSGCSSDTALDPTPSTSHFLLKAGDCVVVDGKGNTMT